MKILAFFQNLRIRSKLTVGFASMIVFMTVIGYAGYSSVKDINENLDQVFSVELPSIDYLLEADRDLHQLLVAERSMIFTNTNSDTFKDLVEEYNQNLKQTKERVGKFKALNTQGQENKLIEGFEKAMQEWSAVSKKIVDGRLEDTREGRRIALDLSLGEARDKFEAMRDYLDKLTNVNLENVAKAHKAAGETYRGIVLFLITLICLGIVVGMALAWLISHSIVRPVKAAVTGLKDIAQGEGDLTMRLEVNSRDEVGELAKWFNVFVEKLQTIIKQITDGVETLSSSSTELSAISKEMSGAAQNTSDKANAVATASEEMSANMNTMAASMEQTTTNTQMVATSAEEMSSTINEIAKNSERARQISDQAAKQAIGTSDKMKLLGDAAQSIGKVIETITDISEQVNLLALNATIEAARAGEAGKGFAVVANEIKELAKQTAQATQDIKEKIESIQGTTSVTVKDIDAITKVINDVNDVVSGIATAVEEQSAATSEIANNVSQASQGIQEVNSNAGQSSQVAADISRDIADVSSTANEMSTGSSQVNMSAQDLSKLSEQLKNMVNQFKI